MHSFLDWLQQARYLDRQRQFSWPMGTAVSPMGQVFGPGKIHGKRENNQTGWWEHARHLPRPQPSRRHLQAVDTDKLCSGAAPSATRCIPRTSSAAARLRRRRGASPVPFLLFPHGSVSQEVLTAGTGHGAAKASGGARIFVQGTLEQNFHMQFSKMHI
jgi:hypothetical protein